MPNCRVKVCNDATFDHRMSATIIKRNLAPVEGDLADTIVAGIAAARIVVHDPQPLVREQGVHAGFMPIVKLPGEQLRTQ